MEKLLTSFRLTVTNGIKYIPLLQNLIVRDLKKKYRKNILGYVWCVLNPLLVMVIMTIVFSRMFRSNISNYPVYLFTGRMVFSFIIGGAGTIMRSIVSNGSLIRKTRVPYYVFPLASFFSSVVDFLFTLIAFAIVLLFTWTPVSYHILMFPVIVLEMGFFTLGLGLILAVINLYVRDIDYVWAVATVALTYLTPMFYPIEALSETVGNLIDRTAKKINVRREELLPDEEIEKKRIAAELINVNISRLPKGVDHYELENYYDENRVLTVKVSPELGPAKTAQKYYKEYKKAQTAKRVLAEQIEKGVEELAYLKTVQDALTRALSGAEITEIREELIQTGFLRRKSQGKVKKLSVRQPLKLTSPNGYPVLVGRNNLQNDQLSFRIAGKNDMWFHVQKAPGSHVVLALDGDPMQDADAEFAAGIAVWFSSVRERGKAEVDYTPVRFLKKPAASNPGFVTYHVYKTVYANAVRPELKQED